MAHNGRNRKTNQQPRNQHRNKTENLFNHRFRRRRIPMPNLPI